jgi:hypothetical protein
MDPKEFGRGKQMRAEKIQKERENPQKVNQKTMRELIICTRALLKNII